MKRLKLYKTEQEMTYDQAINALLDKDEPKGSVAEKRAQETLMAFPEVADQTKDGDLEVAHRTLAEMFPDAHATEIHRTIKAVTDRHTGASIHTVDNGLNEKTHLVVDETLYRDTKVDNDQYPTG